MKNILPCSHIKTEEGVFTRTQQISTVSSPSIDRTNSTILLASTDEPDENIVYEYVSAGDSISNNTQNESRFSAHSKSSSKKSFDETKSHFSAHSHSPSKKSMDETVLDSSSPLTVVAVDGNIERVHTNSRPISVSSVATTKSLYEDYELRPCTSVSKSISSASTTSHNSKSLADENDRPISNISRATLNAAEENIEKVIDQNSDEEQCMDLNHEKSPENVVKEEDAEHDVEHLQTDDQIKPDDPVPYVEPEEHIEVVDVQTQPISSDNESNCTTEEAAIDEVDFIKEPSDEHTTTSTVSSVQNFSVRPSIRFRKRKVSPTKAVSQITSRQKPKDQHVQCLQQLDSSNWDQIMLGLQTFVCLMRNNPEQIEPQLHQYCLALSKNIKNLRSQVSRASCQAAGEFFESHSKLLEQEADDLALALLNRTADTNKFLRSDATKALKIMCETLSIQKVSLNCNLRYVNLNFCVFVS